MEETAVATKGLLDLARMGTVRAMVMRSIITIGRLRTRRNS